LHYEDKEVSPSVPLQHHPSTLESDGEAERGKDYTSKDADAAAITEPNSSDDDDDDVPLATI
jgi:hypothetical protein